MLGFFFFLIEISVTNCCAAIFLERCVCVSMYLCGVIKSLLSTVRLTSGNIGINYNVEIFILGPNSIGICHRAISGVFRTHKDYLIILVQYYFLTDRCSSYCYSPINESEHLSKTVSFYSYNQFTWREVIVEIKSYLSQLRVL